MSIDPSTVFAAIQKIYSIYKEVSSYFSSSTTPDIPQLINKAKEEIINEMQEIHNQEWIARVKSQMEKFISFGFHSPDEGELDRFIEAGFDIKSVLESTIEGDQTQPKLAYLDAIPYNTLVPMMVATMKKRGDNQQGINRILGQALETNKLLKGDTVSTPHKYYCPPNKKCFIESKVWKYVFEEGKIFKEWEDEDTTIKCYGYKKYSIDNREVFGIYAESYFEGYTVGLVSYGGTNTKAGEWMSQCELMLLEHFQSDPVFKVVSKASAEIRDQLGLNLTSSTMLSPEIMNFILG